MLNKYLLLCALVSCISGCAFFERFEQNQKLWNAYRNSPAYNQTTYTSTYTDNSGSTTRCYTTCGRYDCETKCYSY